jgi:hypothetical protein
MREYLGLCNSYIATSASGALPTWMLSDNFLTSPSRALTVFSCSNGHAFFADRALVSFSVSNAALVGAATQHLTFGDIVPGKPITTAGSSARGSLHHFIRP